MLAAEEGNAPVDDPQTDIRKEMLSEYSLTPSKPDPASKAANADSVIVRAKVDPPSTYPKDVIRMDPFVVQQPGSADTPSEPMLQVAPAARAATAATKLGIGVHHFRLGELRMFAGTVFYIPFVVGFEW